MEITMLKFRIDDFMYDDYKLKFKFYNKTLGIVSGIYCHLMTFTYKPIGLFKGCALNAN